MKPGLFQLILRLLCCAMVIFPDYAFAVAVNIPGFNGPAIKAPAVQLPASQPSTAINIPGFYGPVVAPPPQNTLPVLQNVVQGATVASPAQNQLTVQQNQQQAIIDWSSFNISSDASVQFFQQGKDQQGNAWVGTALNRIWDRNPSLIFGSLKADGNIYLINQNGILFGPGSQVNVGSITASTLNITNSNFLNNVLHFNHEDYIDDPLNPLNPLAAVSNHGEINAADSGYIFLMGPRVENFGMINAPIGQIGLVAGTDVQFVTPDQNDTSRSGFYVIVNDNFTSAPKSNDATFGNAVNREGGRLYADGGMAGMYGNNIDQWGIIRSMTAFKNRQGQVELRAANRVTTAANSIIFLPVNPSTTDTVSDTFDIQPIVNIGGLQSVEPSTGAINIASPVKRIELAGTIVAPTGNITLSAGERVYLETGSRIDVSGVVADLPASVLSDFKVTSVELRDNYEQKDGAPQGDKVTTPMTAGSNIGDISQAVLTQDKTALERSVGGAMRKVIDPATGTWSYEKQIGTVNISAANGDVIVKQGAVIDFSGGVINYESGLVNSTKLLSGTSIYDISNAPSSLHYDKALGRYERTYEGFGIKESYSGLYYGGATSLKTYVKGYKQGGDAGQLTITASNVVLAGQIDGGVTPGPFQTAWTAGGNNSEALALSVAQGLEAPRAGTLVIGNPLVLDTTTSHVTAISVVSDTSSQSQDLNPESPLQTGPTLLSAKVLNDAKLSTLNLYADLTISTAQDVSLQLQPGGAFSATARSIDHEGKITVPAGTISMIIGQNLTSRKDMNNNDQAGYVPLEERIVIGPESVLDVSGERIDNSPAGNAGNPTIGSGQTNGGKIIIKDETDEGSGVFIQKGAVVDVSGGYSIDQKGKVTGGNAGALSIQGAGIMLDGELRGYALADSNGKIQGGSISLTSKEIHVYDHTSDAQDPAAGVFYLADNRLDDTGFTQITLNSINDVVVEQNAKISPSLVRLNNPTPAPQTGSGASGQGQEVIGSAVPGQPDLIRLDDSTAFMAGPSSFTASAGSYFDGYNSKLTGNLKAAPDTPNVNAKITISPGAVVSTAPAVSSNTAISLKAPSIDIAGKLVSPGGNISANATLGNLLVENGAEILACGYNRPDSASTPKGFALNCQPVSGGSVALSAGNNLTLDAGSNIDISGAAAVQNNVLSDTGVISYNDAGNPGRLSLTYYGKLDWSGTVKAGKAKNLDGIGGATLTISMTNTNQGLEVKAADIKKYMDIGFDDLTLKSWNSLIFSDAMNVAMGRKLTLDAPLIVGSANDVKFSAPWIVLTNSSASSMSAPALTGEKNALELSGQWIDVIGSVKFGGFQDVTLKADRDIRLSEALLPTNVTSGELDTKGNLTLDADRVYPGNYYSYKGGSNTIMPDLYSDFTIQAAGIVTIRHTGQSVGGPIYSAGGTLTIEGDGGIDIERGGTLAAPMGAINLSAPGHRIYLADGSVVTTGGDKTAGNAAADNTMVDYGLIDSSNLWVTQDKTNPSGADYNSSSFNKDSLPHKGVSMNADEVVAMQGSLVDVSGGGAVFAYRFQPGIQGSKDPLAKPGRYIVFKDNSLEMPGTAVYLNGGGGLSEGMYTLLPLDAKNPQNANYAFMPGAYIIEVQSGASIPGQGSVSNDGYPLIVGYSAVAGTSIRSTRPQVYSVRKAGDVLTTEGNYITPDPLVSGDAGDLAIKGNTTIIAGALNAAALPDYQGGQVALGGTNIVVQSEATAQLSDFGFGTSFDSRDDLKKLKGELTLSADSLSGKGFREVSLGDKDNTQTITIGTADKPVQLEAPIITLAAKQEITIEDKSVLQAVTDKDKDSGEGAINLTTPGTLDIEAGSVLNASHSISLDANNVSAMKGSLKSEGGHGALTLKSSTIYFDDGSRTDNGLHLTQYTWDNNITGFQDITLISNSDNNSGIQFWGNFGLSAGNSLTLDAGSIVNMSPNDVSLTAPTINLRNSGTSRTSPVVPVTSSAAFTAAADTINIGDGDVLFAGFKSIDLNSKSDLTFVGKGSLTTGNADLAIKAARVATTSTSSTIKNPDGTTTTSVTAADFVVYTGANYYNDRDNPSPDGNITIDNSDGTPGKSSTPGGMLEFLAGRIDLTTVVQQDGGTINLVSTGAGAEDGIFLHSGGQILAGGTDNAPGGKVTLRSENGSIGLDSGTTIDISAGKQGDAGVLTLQAPFGVVSINGDLKGKASGGAGASFNLYANQVSDFAALNLKLGDFTESIDLRARTGNIDIASGQTLAANHVKLTADDQSQGSGQINVNGTIDASASADAGTVELYANNDLNIGGTIFAKGTTKGEEDVVLSSANGFVNLQSAGLIDVSGKGTGQGVVHLRAQQQNGNDVKINLNGTIQGASAVYAEAVRVYDNVSAIDSDHITAWQKDTQTYMANSDTINKRLLASVRGVDAGNFHLLAGVEVRNAGDITLNDAWNLTSQTDNKYDWRYGGEPGVLTIRAAGNLNINNDLVDHPTDTGSLTSSPVRNSWAFNLTAGADMTSADYTAVVRDKGDLSIADQTLVYTESAPIRFASGRDTVIGMSTAPGYMVNSTIGYNLATYSGTIQGHTGRDLRINGGAVQTATGDIDIYVGRDLNFGSGTLGAIRTTGEAPADLPQGQPTTGNAETDYWRYTGGGDITIEAARYAGSLGGSGHWTTATDKNAWDSFTPLKVPGVSDDRITDDRLMQFSANYTGGAVGVATMGGGNLTVRTGGDCMVQTGTFGSGDLSIYSGGDIKGRFLNKDGKGEIHAMGNFGSADERQQIELFNSQMDVTAQGEIQIGAVLNPTLASDKVKNSRTNYFVDCTYTQDTSIRLEAGSDITIAGRSPFYSNSTNYSALSNETVMPANVNISAGGDIFLLNNLTLTSSPTGKLSLTAGGDISGSYLDALKVPQTGSILMSDIAPAYWYGLFRIDGTDETQGRWITSRTVNYHGFFKPEDAAGHAYDKSLHFNDDQAVEISAGRDIMDLKLFLPKKADVTAGRDIFDIRYEGQNTGPDDQSIIKAGGNIIMKYSNASDTSSTIDLQPHEGLIQGGPGIFLVQAGGSIDLGSLKDGIQTIGNGANASLGTGKSSLIVVAGYDKDLTMESVGGFFNGLRDSGDLYSMLVAGVKQEDAEQFVSKITSGEAKVTIDKMRAEAGSDEAFYKKLTSGGDKKDADELLKNTRADTALFLGEARQGTGYINMTSSQIGTSIGKSDVFVIANGIDANNGSLNLGKTALPIGNTTNTKTGIATGGGGAVNIFARKDVNVNESRIMTFYGGDITVWSDDGNINAGRGSRTAVSASPPRKQTINGVTTTVFTPPAIGSGIRAVTYGDNPPPPGNIHLFAPTGIIDAGEAGVQGGQIILAAVQVVNSSNISFSSGSVGVPSATAGTAGIGTLSGAGTATTATAQLSQDAAAMGASKAVQQSQMLDNIIAKWLDVKVIDFVQDDNKEE